MRVPTQLIEWYWRVPGGVLIARRTPEMERIYLVPYRPARGFALTPSQCVVLEPGTLPHNIWDADPEALVQRFPDPPSGPIPPERRWRSASGAYRGYPFFISDWWYTLVDGTVYVTVLDWSRRLGRTAREVWSEALLPRGPRVTVSDLSPDDAARVWEQAVDHPPSLAAFVLLNGTGKQG